MLGLDINSRSRSIYISDVRFGVTLEQVLCIDLAVKVEGEYNNKCIKTGSYRDILEEVWYSVHFAIRRDDLRSTD